MTRHDGSARLAAAAARHRLCIIGGGPAATAILTHLAERLALRRDAAPPDVVTIIEKSSRFGVGRPWSDDCVLPEHLSSLPEGVSRSAYGNQQPRRVQELQAYLAEFGVAVELVADKEALDVEQIDRGFRVHVAGGDRIDARFAVLATGHWDARDGERAQRPFAVPWPARRLQRTLRAAGGDDPLAILILGTYLTGVDSAVTVAHALGKFVPAPGNRYLFASPHEFRITMASRRALLPSTWSRNYEPYRCEHFRVAAIERLHARAAGISLQRLYALLRDELRAAELLHYARAIAENPRIDGLIRHLHERQQQDPAKQLASRLRLACGARDQKSGQDPDDFRRFQALLFDTLHVLSETYHLLCAEDRTLFENELRGAYFCHAMPMPAESTAKLLALMDAGRLDVLRLGHEYRLDVHGGTAAGLSVPGAATREFGFVVDARGQSGDIRTHPSRLFARLLERGAIQPALARCGAGLEDTGSEPDASPSGFRRTGGIYVNPSSCEVVPLGHQDFEYASDEPAALFAMGPNLTGQFLDAQSRGQLDRDARRILSEVARRIAATQSPLHDGHRNNAPT